MVATAVTANKKVEVWFVPCYFNIISWWHFSHLKNFFIGMFLWQSSCVLRVSPMVCSFEIREIKQAIAIEFWDLLTDKRNQCMAEYIKTGPFCDEVLPTRVSIVSAFKKQTWQKRRKLKPDKKIKSLSAGHTGTTMAWWKIIKVTWGLKAWDALVKLKQFYLNKCTSSFLLFLQVKFGNLTRESLDVVLIYVKFFPFSPFMRKYMVNSFFLCF